MRAAIFCGIMALLASHSSSAGQPISLTTDQQLEIMQQEAWHFFMSRVVAFQPAKVGAKKFLITFLPPSKNQEVVNLKLALMRNKDWPQLMVEKDALVILYKGKKSTLELVDIQARKFLLNGKKFEFDARKSLLSQVEESLRDTNATWRRLSLIPEAQAGISDTSPTALIHAAAIGGALSVSPAAKAFFMYGFASVVSAGKIGGVAIAAGGAAVITAKAVAIASLACGVYAVGDTLLRKDRGIGGNFLNCAASPLSLINKNPRDRLYLADVQCTNDKNELSVRLISPTRREETRTFTYAGERLKSLEMLESPNKAKLSVSEDGTKFEKGETQEGLLLYRPRSSTVLDSMDRLLSDFEYYRGLCVGEGAKGRRDKVLRLIKDNNYGERAYDERSVKGVNDSAE